MSRDVCDGSERSSWNAASCLRAVLDGVAAHLLLPGAAGALCVSGQNVAFDSA